MSKKIIVVCILVCLCLTACSNAVKEQSIVNEVYDKLQSESKVGVSDDIIVNAANITEEINGDYLYWKPKVLNHSDRLFWDMSANDGSGCKLGDLIYFTQIVNPAELGFPVGQPIEAYMIDISTEQNVLWNMSGYQFNEWGVASDGTTVKYKLYDCNVFNTVALDDKDWTFMVHRYIMAKDNDDSTERTYFNILGLSEFNGEWLTMELTGNYAENDVNIAEYKAIVAEFAEIYGFMETFEAKRDACADYFISRIV